MIHDVSDAADTARLAIIWRVLRQRWRLLIVIAVLGALVGAGASLVLSPGYETSASVLLQGPRDPDELTTEAQVAHSTVVLDRTAAALRWGRSGADLADDVTATVADGNIIEITGVADTPEQAQQLADRVAQEYVTFSTQLMANTADASAQVSQEQQETLRQQIIETNQKISDLHNSAGQGQTIDSVGVRTELESLRTALSQAVAKLDELDTVSSSSKIVVMGPAERPLGPATPTMTHFVAGGAVVFLVLGVFGHLFAARADKRLRDDEQITAALGTAVMGGVDVPDVPEAAAAPAPKSWWQKVAGLVVDDRPWHLPELPSAADETGLDIRYRRALSRLREHLPPGPGRVLVVVAKDDPAARRAADRLGAVAAESRLALQVVEVDADRPVVPDEAVPGVLVVVTTGTRTGWQLVGIAEACRDAGHEVLGAVVTRRARPLEQVPDRPAEPALAGAP
ncbi:Wzz/FepE/Etk N-terminal domain-containing protein [Actinophytocola algeriensis]|uniref:Wzz/FepE/Etk N-terminal domain-containing protein n=1 Tax=Actinophytocola algeriensis TaxID=1768010 RepID=UPI0035DA88ED